MSAKKSNTTWTYFKRLNNWANDHEWVMILVAIMIFLRLPTLWEPFWYGDENIYLAIGQGLRKGLTLYKDVTDYPNKPPMIYWLSSWLQTVPNLRFFLLLWQIPGVIFFHRLVNKLVKNVTSAFFTTLAFVYLTSTPLIEGTIGNAEIFFIVPVVVGVSLLADLRFMNHDSGKKRAQPSQKATAGTVRVKNKSLNLKNKTLKITLAGVFLALGFLFKIHVLLDVAFVGLFFFIFPYDLNLKSLKKMVTDKTAWQFIGGFLSVICLVMSYFAIRGVQPSDLLRDASGSVGYTQAWSSEEAWMQTIGMGALSSRAMLLLVIIVFLYLIKKKLDKNTLFAILWLVLTLFAALLSARPYPHYLLQVVPPLVIAVTLLFHRKNLINNVVIILSLLLCFGAYQRFEFSHWGVNSYYRNFISYVSGEIDQNEYYRRFDHRMPRNYAIAKSIRLHSQPDDQIYVWGTEPDIYVLANRLQTGPLVVSFHVDDLGYYDETIQLLEANPPEIIVMPGSEWREFKDLNYFLQRDYYVVETVGDPAKSPEENKDFEARIYKKAQF